MNNRVLGHLGATSSMNEEVVSHKWNELNLIYSGQGLCYGKRHIICRSTVMQIKFGHLSPAPAPLPEKHQQVNCMLVQFSKIELDDPLTYVIKIGSNVLNINKTIESDNDDWRVVSQNIPRAEQFDVSVQLDIKPSATTFSSLFDDTEFIDVQLRAQDGVLDAHKTILAISSEFWRHKLISISKDRNDMSHTKPTKGKMNISNISGPSNANVTNTYEIDMNYANISTLNHLKEYLYLGVLPNTDEGLLNLLLVAACNMLKDLEKRCIFQLLSITNESNIHRFLECSHMYKLVIFRKALLEHVHSHDVDVQPVLPLRN